MTTHNLKAHSKGYDLDKTMTYKERLQLHIDNNQSSVMQWQQTQEQTAHRQALNWLKQA